jgi:hypothetical protein
VALELSPCRVHGEGGELVAAGHVRSADAATMHIDAPRYAGHALVPGDRIVLEVDSPVRGECTFDGVVATSVAGTLVITELRLRDVVQRRSAVRVPLTLLMVFDTIVLDGEDVVLDPQLTVVVMDISADGLRFRANPAVPIGTQLKGIFPARRPVRLLAEVVRHEPLRGAVAHGCRFLGMSEADRDLLIAYVLRQERLMLAERRETLSG